MKTKKATKKTRLKKDDTVRGREIWEAVDRAANSAPQWAKAHVKEVSVKNARAIFVRLCDRHEMLFRPPS